VLSHFEAIAPNVIRQFLLWHEETGHNPGGLHAAFRVLRTFLLRYESEAEPEGCRNFLAAAKADQCRPLQPLIR
jgi:hypothetical protein